LEERKFEHLARHILWGNESDTSDKIRRSKVFINILKARIHLYKPSELPEIVKNEAHLRLVNSLWYAAKSIRFISVIFFAFGILGVLFKGHVWKYIEIIFNPTSKLNTEYALFLCLFVLVQFFIGLYIRRSIKKYFHYLRVREIVYVLEIASMLETENKNGRRNRV
jgi:hypothetical protein